MVKAQKLMEEHIVSYLVYCDDCEANNYDLKIKKFFSEIYKEGFAVLDISRAGQVDDYIMYYVRLKVHHPRKPIERR